MAIKSIYKFEVSDLTKSGRAIGAIINNRYRIPVLKALLELGIETNHTNEEIHNYLADKINLTQADFIKTGAIEWHYRIKWALNQLKNAQLIDKDPTQYMSWKLSMAGKEFLNSFDLINSVEIEEDKIEEARKKIDYLVDEKNAKNKIRYWAGGFGRGDQFHSRLQDFIKNNYWQALDYDEDSNLRAANKAINLFEQIEIGDQFIIKGYGGNHDLNIHYIGEVINKIDDEEKLIFKSLNIPVYHIKAPRGPGAGNWRDTILEVTRKEDIDRLFKGIITNTSSEEQGAKLDSEENKNTILYGPPGTGKTYNSISKSVELALDESFDTREEYKGKFDELRSNGQIEFVTFHQNYSYEDFVVGIKPDLDDANVRFKKNEGVFYRICKRAEQEYLKPNNQTTSLKPFEEVFEEFLIPLSEHGNRIEIKMKSENTSFWITDINANNLSFEKQSGGTNHTLSIDTIQELYQKTRTFTSGLKYYYQPLLNELWKLGTVNQENNNGIKKKYVIVIDEINRGNISKIFGELITLIEDDKRIGTENELRITLQNGEQNFGVPPNLYIIGTMNTADKSIALVDIALRRRFEFEGYYPTETIINELLEKELLVLKAANLLKHLNTKIYAEKNSADYLIGHAYLINKTVDQMDNILRNKIIPLLMEYFSCKIQKVEQIFEGSAYKVKYNTVNYSWDIE